MFFRETPVSEGKRIGACCGWSNSFRSHRSIAAGYPNSSASTPICGLAASGIISHGVNTVTVEIRATQSRCVPQMGGAGKPLRRGLLRVPINRFDDRMPRHEGSRAPCTAECHLHLMCAPSQNANLVVELLRQLRRDGSTICIVTHDPRFAQHAERGIRLFEGRVVT